MCSARKKGKRKKKKYDDFSRIVCRESTNITRNACVTTINRGSIRADSPLITNKYLTSSLPTRLPRLCFQRFACFRFIRCVRFKRSSGESERERGREREGFIFIPSNSLVDGVERSLAQAPFPTGKDSCSCTEWSNFFFWTTIARAQEARGSFRLLASCRKSGQIVIAAVFQRARGNTENTVSLKRGWSFLTPRLERRLPPD